MNLQLTGNRFESNETMVFITISEKDIIAKKDFVIYCILLFIARIQYVIKDSIPSLGCILILKMSTKLNAIYYPHI